jgi:hypothetical protein
MNMLVRDRTAFHEAGHVVVGLAVGYEVRRAWLVDERSGLTCFTESSPPSQEAQLAMLTAGFRAEGMALKLSCVGSPQAFLRDVDDFLPLFEEGVTPADLETIGHDHDPARIAHLLKGHPWDEIEAALYRAVDMAQDILDARWSSVEEIAAVLMSAGAWTPSPQTVTDE